ncbi:hypothetical protein ANCDUO_00957 [Ancylostoma duodenale]|uniref:Reverse transcriptase domain-containing protein n=1 Tax=Ancylostoma duodenale TaxID=51022 RepID=A0A0C2DFC4_9BILA|nr:hypothetical protein ANCDUO_00957 [Ancylostoma duodenale]
MEEEASEEEIRKTASQWKHGNHSGEPGLRWLTKFFNNITRSATIPEAWRDSIIVPIFKRKGDVMDCTNYRGIKLI